MNKQVHEGPKQKNLFKKFKNSTHFQLIYLMCTICWALTKDTEGTEEVVYE